jgi:hypothetical protein
MSEHDTPCAEDNCNANSCVDAKALIALIVIVVTTVCFWLVGQ